MPTPTRNLIQVDSVPREYDPRQLQRVLEGMARQLSAGAPAEAASASTVRGASGVTPRSPTGALTTTQVVLYKVPQGAWAEVVAASFVNTGATARDLDVYVREPGGTPRRAVRFDLIGGVAAGNDFTLGDERWVLTEGMTIEAKQDVGTDVEYHLSILERAL